MTSEQLPCPSRHSGTNGLSWLVGAGMHDQNMKRTVVWLTEQQVKELTKISQRSLAPLSAIVREAVREFLEPKKKKRK